MSHKRTGIRDALVVLLKGGTPYFATDAGSRVYSNRIRNLSSEKLPAIVVLDQSETATPRATTGTQYIRTWNVKVEVRIEASASCDEKLDDLCKVIEDLIMSDRTLSGTCTTIKYTGTEPEYDDSGEKTIGHASMNYEIQYIS